MSEASEQNLEQLDKNLNEMIDNQNVNVDNNQDGIDKGKDENHIDSFGNTSDEDTKIREKIVNDRPWLWKKGQVVNPNGRPKGTRSMKQWVKEKLAAMSDDEREEYLMGIPKELVWKMAEGMPDAKTDITSGGNVIKGINIIAPNGTGDNIKTIAETIPSVGEAS